MGRIGNFIWKYGVAYKAMKALGYSKEIVQPILKDLLNTYEQNWDLIEEGNYSVLLEAILDSEEHKKEDNELVSRLEDEPEENERPLKRYRLRSKNGSSRPSSAHIKPEENECPSRLTSARGHSSKAHEMTAQLQYTEKDDTNRTYKTQKDDELASQQRMSESITKKSGPLEPSSVMEKPECIVLSDSEDGQNDQGNDELALQAHTQQLMYEGSAKKSSSPESSSIMGFMEKPECTQMLSENDQIDSPFMINNEGTSLPFLALTYTSNTDDSFLENPNVLGCHDVSPDTNAPGKFNSAAGIPVKETLSDNLPETKLQLVFPDLQTSKMARTSNWKYGLAYKAMKALGYPKEIVQPILKSLLDTYEQSWALIEGDNYSVLLEAILDSKENKKEDNQVVTWFEDEPKENESPLKRSRLRSKNGSNRPSSAPIKSEENDQGNDELASQSHFKQLIYEGYSKKSSSTESSSIMGFMETPECIQMLSENENDQIDSPFIQNSSLINTEGTSPPFLALTCTSNADDSILENPNVLGSPDVSPDTNAPGKFNSAAEIPVKETLSDDLPGECLSSGTSNAKEKHSALSDTILLGSGEKDGSSNGHGAHSLKFPDSEDSNREGVNDGSSDSSQLDIASSLKGEAKICLIYKCSSQSDFCVPSLDSVVQKVEEECIKSFKITEPGFSFLKLMEEVCERFIASGAVSNEKTSSLHAQSTAIVPVKHNLPMFCIASEDFNGSIMYQNLIKIQPQIPRDIICKRSRDAEEDRMVVWKQQYLPKPLYYVEDITKGEEEVKISLVNEFNNDGPPAFMYIPRNIVFKDAHIKVALACISDYNCCSRCAGDCLSLETPCACAGKTYGEFAYTAECLVKEKFLEKFISMNHEPQKHNHFYCQDCPLKRSNKKRLPTKCKGHLARKFIKECWHRCGCSKKCGNRVVQRGITEKLQVFMTPDGTGWGLRTLKDLPKGAFVCEYVGEIITNKELVERNMQSANEKHSYHVLLDADWTSERVLKDKDALYLDATRYGNVARFINHRCFDANLVEIPVEIETPDHRYYHLAFFTTRNIKASEELAWDYGIDFNHPEKPFKCQCGSKQCRDTKPKRRKSGP